MSGTKHCSKCGIPKLLSEFFASRRSSDGRKSQCKDCDTETENVIRWNKANRRRKTLVTAQWRKAHPESVLISSRRDFAKRDPEKLRARHKLRYAVRKGRLVRQPCERCGATPTHAHHHDYSKPLDVRWLCRRCHRMEHPEPTQ